MDREVIGKRKKRGAWHVQRRETSAIENMTCFFQLRLRSLGKSVVFLLRSNSQQGGSVHVVPSCQPLRRSSFLIGGSSTEVSGCGIGAVGVGPTNWKWMMGLNKGKPRRTKNPLSPTALIKVGSRPAVSSREPTAYTVTSRAKSEIGCPPQSS